MTAAVAATGLLGAGVIAGLHVNMVTAVVRGLQTFNVELPKPPPPPPPPPPRPQPHAVKREQGAPAKAAQPKPVVAPKPDIPLPAKEAAPTVAGNGSANSAGAGTAGNGSGAGGSGNGAGGGGGGAGYTPARKITKIPDSQYRRLSAFGTSSGRVGVSIRVEADGSVSSCRVVSSSGIPAADSLMCQLTQQYVRFSPARDPLGRAIAAQVTFFPDWHHR
jgi:protein TonB